MKIIGCSHQTMWHRADGQNILLPEYYQQFKLDEHECIIFAESRIYPEVVAGYYMKRTVYHTCMQEKGYVGRPGKMKWLTY